LLFDFVLAFPSFVVQIACPTIPKPPQLPEFPIHLLCEFLISMVRSFSKYWAATKILKTDATKQEAATMAARLYLCKAIQITLNNGLRMLTMNPLQQM